MYVTRLPSAFGLPNSPVGRRARKRIRWLNPATMAERIVAGKVVGNSGTGSLTLTYLKGMILGLEGEY